MTRAVAFAIPGDLTTPTGGYAYDRRMIAELMRHDWSVEVLDLGEGFPSPTQDTRRHAQMRLSAVTTLRPIVVDGLAFGVLPQAMMELRERYRLIALVHHPLALESGLSKATANALRVSERMALACARRVIVTSPSTSRILVQQYGLKQDRISVVPPGSDPVEPAQGSGEAAPSLLAVGAVVPRKGYDVLVAALATLTDLPWRLTIAGDRGRDPAYAASLDEAIAQHGLGERIAVLGAVPADRLAALYDRADLFVLASRFEGYGMAYAEAMAHGLPIVGTNAGATPETIAADASVLVQPDDVVSLADTLRWLIASSGERARMTAAAREAAKSLPTWEDTGKLFAKAIEAAV